VKQDKVILKDDVIIAQSVLFILAGFDTTQSLLLFAVYELALCPHVQEKLAKEVRKAHEAGDGFTYENINQLEYLDKVVNGEVKFMRTLEYACMRA
jgi:cytochrome P450